MKKYLPVGSPLLYVLVSGCLGVAGQLILKSGLATLGPLVLRPDNAFHVLLAMALDPLLILGLCVYVSGTFFWLIALSRVDLSYAYPFASLNYVLILLASWLILGERLSALRVVGVVLICFGVWGLSRTPVQTSASRHRTAGASPIGAEGVAR